MPDFGTMNPPLFSFSLNHRQACLPALALVLFLLCPLTVDMPEEWGYENSWIENVQLAVLVGIILLCVTAKAHRSFYCCCAGLVLLLMLREVSYGRTIFFPIEGHPNEFYKWKQIPYGWMAHWLIGLYITAMVGWFLLQRHWETLFALLKEASFPFWGILFAIIGMVLNTWEEFARHNSVGEETAELGMYLSFAYLAAVYTRRCFSPGSTP